MAWHTEGDRWLADIKKGGAGGVGADWTALRPALFDDVDFDGDGDGDGVDAGDGEVDGVRDGVDAADGEVDGLRDGVFHATWR